MSVGARPETADSSAANAGPVPGAPDAAGRLLGRCFSLTGPIVSGQGIGSKQTVPTLNIRPIPGQVLPRGVFVTETLDAGGVRRWPSITNVGNRPTFGGDELTIETYLLSPMQGAPPGEIEVRFRHFVRAERRFPTPDDLKAQIVRDVSLAQSYWRRAQKFSTSPASIY